MQLQEYEDYRDAYRQIGKFLDDVYMRKRIHSSPSYLTPVEFEQQWQQGPGPRPRQQSRELQERQELGLSLQSETEVTNFQP